MSYLDNHRNSCRDLASECTRGRHLVPDMDLQAPSMADFISVGYRSGAVRLLAELVSRRGPCESWRA